jgi:hypothetical protein
MKEFDKHTKEKANGRDRLLIVDGHNSHYTRGFLQHARAHRIHVICYPAHATHVYQGLDVVIFAVLKRYWSEERDKWEREKGEGITKSNFLTIYGQAHLRALTPGLIRTAFRKTGVWPVNRDVVTEKMMAPSKETSCEGHLPITPSSPVKIVAELLRKLSSEKSSDNTDDSLIAQQLPTTTHSEIESVIQRLKGTSLSGLVSNAPLTSDTRPQCAAAHLISPIKKKQPPAYHNVVPKTANEVLLLSSLREAEVANATLKRRVLELQAANILNEMYCNVLRGQLANQEGKKRKGKEGGKLVGDGLPRLLSGDDFYERVVEFEHVQKKVAAEKQMRKDTREKRAEALATWKCLENKRKKENEVRRAQYREALERWKDEKAREGRRFSEKRPVLGKLPGAIPRPTLSTCGDEDEGEKSSEEEFNFNDVSDDSGEE